MGVHDEGRPVTAEPVPSGPQQVEPAVDLFRSAYGAAPAGSWRAPGRVNLIGEHTDYNEGFVLPFALPHAAVVAAAPRTDGVVRATITGQPDVVTADVDAAPGSVEGWAAYVVGVAWALAAAGHGVEGADLALASDVPVGAGLSSSAALECAVAVALDDVFDLGLSRTELALAGQRAEHDYVGAPTGVMDQMAAMHGRAGALVFLDTRSLEVRHVPADFAADGLAVVVVDTRASHSLKDGAYGERRASCERAASILGVRALRDVAVADLEPVLAQLPDDETRRRVRHVVTEDDRVLRTVDLLEAGRSREVGPLLTASHVSLRYDYEVSAPELDVAVDAALDAGAHGARMTGGGFGGSAIALVDADRVDAVAAAVTAAFDERGFREPRTFAAVPSDGAGAVTGSES
jgi:galactokinase